MMRGGMFLDDFGNAMNKAFGKPSIFLSRAGDAVDVASPLMGPEAKIASTILRLGSMGFNAAGHGMRYKCGRGKKTAGAKTPVPGKKRIICYTVQASGKHTPGYKKKKKRPKHKLPPASSSVRRKLSFTTPVKTGVKASKFSKSVRRGKRQLKSKKDSGVAIPVPKVQQMLKKIEVGLKQHKPPASSGRKRKKSKAATSPKAKVSRMLKQLETGLKKYAPP